MLSRVADSLYWMSRYIERAENIARLLEVNLQLLLDFENLDDDKVTNHWEPIIRATGDEALFRRLHQSADNQTVTDFLTFSRDNSNSVQSCVFAARENARSVRDQVSSEMWETLNNLYLNLKSQTPKKIWHSDPLEFYTRIKQSSHLFQGLTDATVSRDEGYEYIQIGKYLERADQTTRILDIKYHILLPKVSDVGGVVDVAQWVALLKSVSGFEAYHHLYVSDVVPSKIIELLVFSEYFPRSIRFCVTEINTRLHRISGCPPGNYSNEAERLCGRLLSELTYGSTDEIINQGMHEYLDAMQTRLNRIGEATYQTYMLQPPLDIAEEIAAQKQRQP